MIKKFRLLLKKCLTFIARPAVTFYFKKERIFRHDSIRLTIPPGVFHPGIFHSTKLLLEYLRREELKGKTFLELGCGSGLISIWVYKRGATVTASDISRQAVDMLKINARQNAALITIIHSDLFDNIAPQHYDFIVINPPFYRGRPQTEADLAWYAGENLEYFQNLFNQLKQYLLPETKVIMVISEYGLHGEIKKMAHLNRFQMKLEYQKSFLVETYFIYRLLKSL